MGDSGGSGGSIFIQTVELYGEAQISANGGNGTTNNTNYGGGGSGGRIAIYASRNYFQGSVSTYGGRGTNVVAPGTIFVRDTLLGHSTLSVLGAVHSPAPLLSVPSITQTTGSVTWITEPTGSTITIDEIRLEKNAVLAFDNNVSLK